jgi:hypothetical protein
MVTLLIIIGIWIAVIVIWIVAGALFWAAWRQESNEDRYNFLAPASVLFVFALIASGHWICGFLVGLWNSLR